MIIKMFWKNCHELIVEDEDAFLIEADKDEVSSVILPRLNSRERLKFDQMKGIYIAKETAGRAKAGSYYFLVSREKEIKFESVAILTADLSSRGGAVKILPDIAIGSLDDLDGVDPAAY